jgi:hypothetical protein
MRNARNDAADCCIGVALGSKPSSLTSADEQYDDEVSSPGIAASNSGGGPVDIVTSLGDDGIDMVCC